MKKVRCYTQFGEHEAIAAVFGVKPHVAVEVGASDGLSGSNTKHLEATGWRVLCIEPNPRYAARLKRNRKHVMTVACGPRNRDDQEFTYYEVAPKNYEVGSSLAPTPEMAESMKSVPSGKFRVDVRTLDWCLKAARFTKVDLVSIDVEGYERQVLKGFSLARWRPKMVILEDWRGGWLRSYMCKKGYYVMTRRGVNEIFLRADDE